MRFLRKFPLFVLTGILLCGWNLMAQSSTSAAARIVDRIDESQLTVLHGNTHPAAVAKNDLGRVASNLRMTDMVLVLSRSAESQAAFEAFVASQYDQNSANYHHWLAPAEVGQKFGPAPGDIATVSAWLSGHGFHVDEVSNDRMSIRFSGTAAQVESAFHTEIHNLMAKGVAHIGNMSDPQIPTSLAPVVVGVKALHNFFPRPMHRLGNAVTRDTSTGKWQRPGASASSAKAASNLVGSKVRPQFGIGVPASGTSIAYLVEDVTPYDFATIYNVLPLWQAGTAIDGTGQSIAIAGISSIVPSDVATFRSLFGLPANAPTIVSGNGTTPTVCIASTTSGAACTLDDLIENSLDVEWSGAVAKGASITLVTSASKSTSDDTLYDSESYIVNNKLAPIMNVSYGECELELGTAGNVQYYNLWQTAASEGIAVFVSSGDSGSATCDNSTSTPSASKYGLAVSGITSTPYNTSVGGTDFNWCSLASTSECTPSPYWNSTNASNGSSAKGYVPEVPWNDTCTSSLAIPFIEELATSLNISNVNDAETACNFVADPTVRQEVSYYDGFDPAFFVQTVGGSGGASGCVVNDGSNTSSCVASTTSTGSLNGSIPLSNDGWQKPAWQTSVAGIPSDGVRDVPDVSFFASNGSLSASAYLICVAQVTSTGQCTYLTNSKPTALEVGGTSVASPAMAGVMALINQKAGAPQGSPNAQLYELAAKQNYSNCNGANGSPASTCFFNDITTGTNAMACDDGFFGSLSPNCKVTHSADSGGMGVLSGYSATAGYDLATGLGSLNVANVVNGWSSDAGTGTAKESLSLSASTITGNDPLTLTVTMTGSGSLGAPTGDVFLTGGGYTTSQALTGGIATITIPANSLTAGQDTLTVNYGGDANYASVSQTITVQVNVMTPTVTVTTEASPENIHNPLPVTVTLTGPTGSTIVPTGTVSISADSYVSGGMTLANGVFTFTLPAETQVAGSDMITVSYSGDSNYSAGSGTANVTMVDAVLLTPSLAVTPASSTVDTGQAFGVTVAASGSGGTPTNFVTLTAGSYTSASVALANGVASFTVPANSLNAGTASLKVSYTGDSVYAASTGTGSVTVTASAFTLVLTPASGTATAGGTSTSTITLTSSTNYSGTVTLGCAVTSYPTNATFLPTCSAASTLTMSGGTQSGSGVTLTIQTTAASSELVWPKLGNRRGWTGAGGGAVLAFLIFLGVPARRRKWLSMLGILLVLVALGGISGCGGGSGSTSITGTSGTTAGAYTLTITGTGNDPSSTQETATFNLTVN